MKRSPLLFLLVATACAHVAGGETRGTSAPERARDVAAGAPVVASTPGQEARRAGDEAVRRGPPSGARPEEPEDGRSGAEPGVAPPQPGAEADARARLVRAARSHLGRSFAGDCSTFVRRVYAEAGVALPPLKVARTMTESLYRSMRLVRTPEPGDLAYFRRTLRRDRGRNGRDRLTHVAIVEAVHGASVVMIHRGSRGIRRLAMNLARPHDPDENDIVRRRWRGERAGAPSLAGELFAGYGTALRADRESSRAQVESAGPAPGVGGPRG